MNAPDMQIPLPRPTVVSRPFWDGAKRGALMVQKCRDCGHLVHIPHVACTRCLSENLDWIQSSGRGTVYSYSVVWRPQTPAFKPPYVVAIIELEEGWHMLSNVIDCAVEDVHVNLPVEVVFQKESDEITLPRFRPTIRA